MQTQSTNREGFRRAVLVEGAAQWLASLKVADRHAVARREEELRAEPRGGL